MFSALTVTLSHACVPDDAVFATVYYMLVLVIHVFGDESVLSTIVHVFVFDDH